MKPYFKLLSVLISTCILFSYSCKTDYNKQSGFSAVKKTNKQLLDWTGVYTGLMPCDKCDGIEFTITLYNNNKYDLLITYLNEKNSSNLYSGNFSWGLEGDKIYINNPDKSKDKFVFIVSKDKLTQIDASGKSIPSDFPNDYELLKVKSKIVEKKWQLIELGKDTIKIEDYKSIPFISFKAAGLKVNGSSGCNTFTGTYEESEGNKIRFSKMATSLKYCVNMKIEEKFFKVFERVNNFQLKYDTLILRDGRLPALAKFVQIKN